LAWLQARREETRSLLGVRIVGDVGVGKSRLLGEFLNAADTAGDVVVQTGPDPAWAEVGYWALRHAIAQLAALPASGGPARDWVAATAEARQGLADVFGTESRDKGEGLSAEERRFAAAEALKWAIVRANERARGHRVVLAVDDLHAIDGASCNAFSDALGDPPLVPALLVAAYPPGFEPWMGVRHGPSARSDRIADERNPESPLQGGPAEPARLHGVSYDGSALRRTAAPLSPEESGGVPPALADVIAVRVERLPPDARRVLQAASVWGDDADDQVLIHMLGDSVDIVEALGFLRRAGMVHLTENQIRTSHPLVREVTLATIPAAVRRELHAAASLVCGERSCPIEVRALHEAWGGTAFQALLLLEQVSTAASSRGDHRGAIMALRKGLDLARRELFRGELDDPMRAVLIFSRKLGESLAKGGQLNDADGVLREALDVAGPSGNDRAAVLAALAHVAYGRDRSQEAREYMREAVDLASSSGDRDVLSSLEPLRRAIAS
jgi:hypothetical protein